ncbi:uncharacterized protein LOC100823227 isoform X2 [Brachypodium distachyon]|uniref:Uncharacterized protein n=1 Tax=Brachypodium distachyon TaxID=15368 RepID=A0A0Q3HD89_BRADI|nr:uncharacterized protein LOC100823227 isoform X2 [Brachypodium distachyon]KQK20485.1 hypothetical protein BRADI_1g54812v3 [Brachypodium distachyon]|eukprot:XP_003561327.2 uncharacterized protein LOC100823227 isoform X2 [Brachypodium distachyon]
MELFERAKTVRLRSYHDKYMYADEDESHVQQGRNASSPNARWTVEPVPHAPGVIRLRSRYGRYLTASNEPFLLGVTGRKVLQTLPHRLDSSVEWVPQRDDANGGGGARLQTRYGNFLRANGGLPPLRNSITHDVPHHRHAGWILWSVQIVQLLPDQPPPDSSASVNSSSSPPQPYTYRPPFPSPSPAPLPTAALRPPAPPHHRTAATPFVAQPPPPPPGSLAPPANLFRLESADSFSVPLHKVEGRNIHYQIGDNNGNVDEDDQGRSFTFNGTCLEELLERLQEETGLKDVIMCTRSPITQKLMPLRLQLPPNNNAVRIVLVRESSRVAKSFL